MSTETDIEAMEDIEARILGRYQRLHNSHAALIAAAKQAYLRLDEVTGTCGYSRLVITDLLSAITAAEEPTP